MKKNLGKEKNSKYDHTKIEKKWQKEWLKKKVFVASNISKKPKKYVLVEFPYPSGSGLHMGHLRPYIAGDVVSKYWKMKGYNTLYPMGWDAFGLPAENYAIKNKVHPRISTAKNVANAKKQLASWGTGFDWSREINTTDPAYYKWTQWIFLQFFKKGLAYESEGLINWCPKDKTGLANEEVINGKCERCGTEVEKRTLRQWYLKITDYADKLTDGLLHDLPQWPEYIKLQQENWIGRSEGSEIEFKIKDSDKKIQVFTTRADTLFGVTYVVLAPECKLVDELKSKIKNWKEIESYRQEVKNRTDMERTSESKDKTGVKLAGISAINPANGEEVPVFIADYVLATYGTGMVMAVPAHDDRDFAFAKKYHLPIKQVIAPFFVDPSSIPRDDKKWSPRNNVQAIVKHPTEDKIIQIQWKKVPWKTLVIGGVEDGESREEAIRREVIEETGYQNIKKVEKLGWQMEAHFFAVHKDVNRQAFTQVFVVQLADLGKKELSGEEAEKHAVAWVPMSELKNFHPVSELSEILGHFEKGPHAFTGNGKIINSGKFDGLDNINAIQKITQFVGGKIVTKYKLRDWLFSRQRYWGEPIPVIHCEKCGVVAVPEKDLPVKLPNVKNYEPSGTGESPLATIASWVNVKCPECKGPAKRETNTMPQWAGSSWYWLRYVDPKNKKVFADKKVLKYWTPVDLYFGGLEHTTLHLLYSRFWNQFLFDQGLVTTKEPYVKRVPHGIVLGPDGEKMSKSRGNVVNPDDIVKNFGADTMRLHMQFLGPHEAQVAWNDQGIIGTRRFLERVWNMTAFVGKTESEEVTQLLHRTIKKISSDIESASFNTAISAMMVFVKFIHDGNMLTRKSFESFIKLLTPFAPHISEEIWMRFGNKKMIVNEGWPQYDENKLVSSNVKIVVQINGKVRTTLDVPAHSPEQFVEKAAMSHEDVVKWTPRQAKRENFLGEKQNNRLCSGVVNRMLTYFGIGDSMS